MARKPSHDELALHFSAADGQPRAWRQAARCGGLARSSHPMAQAWNLRSPREKIEIDGHCYTGQDLIDFALANCEICPVQWDCAQFAASCEDFHSTYSMLGTDMRWLVRRSGKADTIIAAAREQNISMQQAVAVARDHANLATCPQSPQRPSSTRTTTSPSSPTEESTGTVSRRQRRSGSANGTTESAA